MTVKHTLKKAFVTLLCVFTFTMLVAPTRVTYAAPQTRVNNNEEGNARVEGENDIDVDGHLKDDTKQSSSSEASKNPSTTDVGKSLGDKVSSNAKTGNIFNSRYFAILLIAIGALLFVLGREKKSQTEETK